MTMTAAIIPLRLSILSTIGIVAITFTFYKLKQGPNLVFELMPLP